LKLAEALIERKELQQLNAQLVRRINNNVKVQEGDEPVEKPAPLISEYEHNMERHLRLVKQINATNARTAFDDGSSMADAIAHRNYLAARIRSYREFYNSATIAQDRYGRKEVKFVRCVDAGELQTIIDRLSKEYRALDTKLQALNWTVDLI
jgi:hypothetical protein